jgi:hypothetical protein
VAAAAVVDMEAVVEEAAGTVAVADTATAIADRGGTSASRTDKESPRRLISKVLKRNTRYGYVRRAEG